MISYERIEEAREDLASYYEFASNPMKAVIATKKGFQQVCVLDVEQVSADIILFTCISDVYANALIQKEELPKDQIFTSDYSIEKEEKDILELFQHFSEMYFAAISGE